jgi:hypothetical protein
MTNDENQIKPENEPEHPVATGLGAVGGGVVGAALGRSIGGKLGAAIGGVAGAIAGGVAANSVAEFAEEAIEDIDPTLLRLGANHKPVELPKHFTWEELQTLSKPHGGEFYGTST